MHLRNRLFFTCLALLNLWVLNSQTLYWVGGSGNFNDPKHWSLSSNGSTGNFVPGAQNDIVIDGARSLGPIEITFSQNAKFKSLYVKDYTNPVFFRGTASQIEIGGSVVLAPLSRFEFAGKVIFNSLLAKRNTIDFSGSMLMGDIEFNRGKYEIVGLLQAKNHKVKFEHGDYKFSKSNLTTDNLEILGADTKLTIDTSYFKVNKSVRIPDKSQFQTMGFGFYAPFESQAAVEINPTIDFGEKSRLSSNNINSICEASLYAFPSCPNSCQGTFSLVIDAACAGSTLDLLVSNSNCNATALSLSQNNVSGTIVAPNICACSGGNFNIVIIDNNFIPIPITIFIGATAASNFNFLPPSSSLLTLNTKVPSCNASCDGSLALTISGGNAPYTVQVTGPVVNTFTSAGGFPFQNLCGGVYSFTYTDKYSCSSQSSKTVTAPGPVLSNIVTSSISCFGAANGSISVAPSGGNTGGYTVNFAPGGSVAVASGNTVNLTNLSPGTISYTVTDTKSCSVSSSTAIVQPTDFTVSTSQSTIDCFGTATGTAAVNVIGVSGGTGPGSYSYQWSSPITATASSNSTLSAVVINSVVIQDLILGCSVTQTFQLTQKPQIALSSSVITNVVCNSSLTGAFNATITGGTPNYNLTLTSSSINIGPLAITPTINLINLGANNYTLSLTDAAGCSNSFTFAITQPSASAIQTIAVTSNTCPGGSIGSAVIQASGGSGGFAYTWIGGNSTTASNLIAGNYLAYATDIVGCNTQTITVTITEPPTYTYNINTSSVTCFNAATGTLVVSAALGSAPYQYTLTSLLGSTSNTTGIFLNLPGSPNGVGLYTLTVGDSFFPGSCAQTTVISIDQPTSAVVASFSVTPPTCPGACNATITGSNNGGGSGSGYTYTWTPPSGPTFTTQNLTNRCPGQYSLNVRDGNLCPAPTVTFIVSDPSTMTLSINATSVSCASGQGNSNNGVITTNISGGTGPVYNYTWTPPSGPTFTTQNLSNLTPGNYLLRYTDANGCAPTPPTTLVTIASPTAIVLSQLTQSTTCGNPVVCDGQATVSVVSGGRPNFSFAYAGSSLSGNTTGVFPNVCGPFTVTVTDANSCTTTISNVVGNPPALNAGTVVTNVTCFGVCNGSIVTTPSGGTAPYNYTLSSTTTTITAASGTTAAFTGLCSDTYVLTIQDNSIPARCPQIFTVSVNTPSSSLVSTPNQPSVSCFGTCDGTLIASNASGGTAPYTYVWTSTLGSVSGQTVTGRCAGDYTLRVTDANTCALTATTQISTPTVIAITASNVVQPTCFAGTNGSAAITVTGGPSTTYGYLWSPSAQTSSIATGLSSNSNQAYTVNVTSGVCSKTFAVLVADPASITVVQTNTDVNCFGSCDGLATMSVTSGGVGGFTYSLNAVPVQTNATGSFSNLCTGSFPGFVIDANGCRGTVTVPVGTPTSAIVITGVNTSSSCAVCSGSAAVTTTGGTGPYTYVYTNSLGIVPTLTNSTATGLCPGPYTVTARDTRSCTTSFNFTINPVIILASTVGGTTSCFGSSDGSVAVSGVSGGVPAYSFSWTPSGATTATATNLAAGVYTVRVTDSSSPLNCVSAAVATVVDAASITVSGTVTNVTCPGLTNGSVSVTVSGGPASGAISYFWSPSGSTTSVVSNANFGVHTVTVTKGTCTTSASFTVASPNPPIAAIINSVNPNSCTNPNNGSISIVPSGGDGLNYTFNWSPTASTSSAITSLTPGVYQVTVTSAGCSTVFPSTLSAPLAPSLTSVSQQSIACFGASTGSLTYSTAAISPSFTWSPATTSVVTGGTISASNLPVGTYTLRLSDVNNCTNSITVLVAQAPSITVVTSQTNVLCYTGATGVVSASVSGGTPGTPSYTFNWSNTTTATGSVSAISNLTATAAGVVYSVAITDNNNCTAARSFTVTEPAPFTFTTNNGNVTCLGSANGSITVIANPSTGVTYNWPAVASATFAGSTSSVITGLNPGIYTVTVSDGTCNAVGINTIQITQPPILTSTLTVNHNVTCFNGNNGMATFSVSGGNGAYTYTWVNSTATTAVAGTLTAGNYTAIVVDAQGCTNSASFSISGPANFDATLTATNPKCIAAFNGSISTQVTGGQGTVTYAWLPVGTGQSPTGLSAGTGALTYTLNASDDSLCVVTKTVQLVDPAPIGAGLTFTNPVCFGNCNGVAISSPTGAVGTPTITWLPSGTIASSISGLCSSPLNNIPNIYTVNIVDGNGCTKATTFALSIPQQISANYTVGPALCQTPNGSITLSGVGGTGALTYSWFPPISSTNTVLTNLASGNYSVQIKDINNCTNTVIVPVSASNGPTATVASNSIQCFGQCNGTATVSAISATNITLQWLPPVAGTPTTAAISNLCSGSYTVELTNPTNNCKTYYGVQINTPTVITVSTATAAPTCFGICNGSISVNASGGVPNYTYTWSGPNSYTASAATLTNICGGDYSLTVTDANNCTYNPVISIPVLNNIIIQQPVSVTNNVCFGDCQGSATVNVVSTTTTVLTATLNWSNGQFGNTAVNLCAGVYSVQVTDTRGCSNTFSVPITAAPDMSLATTVVQPQCNQCNGSATVSASGGNGPAYSYTWNNGPTINSASGLCAGLYQVVVKDNSNCTQLKTIIINNSNGITSESITTIDESCAANCNGAGTITAIGGTSPIAYSWITPNLSVTAQSAANLCPGTYFIQMTDANNCIRTSSLEINPAPDFTLSTFITPPTCVPVPAPGFMQAVVIGNTGTVTYSWSPGGMTTPTVSNVAAGTYTLIVTDQGTGCSKTAILPIGNIAGPQYSLNTRDADCLALGGATVVPTGTNALSYLWSTGSTSSVVSNFAGGALSLTVTSANGCVSLSNILIESEPALEVNAQIQRILCHDQCNGGITLLAVNGNLPLTYSITGGSTAYQTFSLCGGNYTATVTDKKGCAVNKVITLINPALLGYTVNSTNSSCTSLSDGSATITASGGLAPYSYTLAGPNNFTAATAPFNNLMAGQYTVNVIDSVGCKTNSSVVNIVPTVTVDAIANPNFSVCLGTEVNLSAAGSLGAVNFVWTDVGSNTTVSSIETYSMVVFDTQTLQVLATSTNVGCFDTDTVIVSVFAKPFLDAGPPSFTMSAYTTTVIGGNPTSLIGGPTHTWAPAEFLDSPESQNPIVSNTLTMTFTVSMVYGTGCFVSDTVQVVIIPQVRISSGFSPNGDGKNDLFVIDYIEQFPLATVEIYNRWGDQLYSTNGEYIPWNGTFKGQDLPVGTYYYVIRLNHFAYPKPITGPVTIFR